jgi:glycosyltransferase involved in cell wall biosynthesis
MADLSAPAYKPPITNRTSLTFAIVGSLREQKNVERVAPLFRDAVASGKLILAGAVSADLAGGHLSRLTEGAEERIICNFQFLSEPELDNVVGNAHYNLLLYVGWDERMESGMLFTSARCGTPVIGLRSGWLGRMIETYGLGYAIDPYNIDEIRECLAHCALPGSPEYQRFEQGIRRLLADYRRDVVAPKFISTLGLPAPVPVG